MNQLQKMAVSHRCNIFKLQSRHRIATFLPTLVLVLVGLLGILFGNFGVAFADTMDELQEEIESGIGNLDFSQMEEISKPFWNSFVDKVRQIINGEFDDAQTFWQTFADVLIGGFSSILPQLISIFCVLVVCGLARYTAEGIISADTENVISFVGVTVVLASVLSLVVECFKQVAQMLNQTAMLAEASMPILLTLVIANGGNALSSVCQPSMVLFSTVVIDIVKNVILPLSVFGLAFVVVSNVSSNIKVSKMSDLLTNSSSWILGIVFMLFSSVTALQGISASTVDGVSYRAAKFAAKNYIPILGGYISDGFDIVVASTSLIKNAFGAVSMLLVFFLVLKPLVTLICVNLGLQAVGAIAEPIVDGKYLKMLDGISKVLTFLSALVFAVAFMFCILTLVAICCANGV